MQEILYSRNICTARQYLWDMGYTVLARLFGCSVRA